MPEVRRRAARERRRRRARTLRPLRRPCHQPCPCFGSHRLVNSISGYHDTHAINVAVYRWYGLRAVCSFQRSISDCGCESWRLHRRPLRVLAPHNSQIHPCGIYSLAFNMWILWSLGRLSERIFGRWQTVFIYLLTGVGGALLSIAERHRTY